MAEDGYVPREESCDLSRLICMCINNDCPVQGKNQSFLCPIDTSQWTLTGTWGG